VKTRASEKELRSSRILMYNSKGVNAISNVIGPS
jgi:hypothetical protein